MRKPAILCLAAALCLGAAARTAADFFTTAPDRVYRLLPQSTRLDMLDYFRFGSAHTSENHLGGRAAMTAETPRTVSYRLSEKGSGQLALVPVQGDTLIAVVTTVQTPLPDSRIDWYRTDWTPVPAAAYVPAYNDWLALPALGERAREIAPFLLVEARFTAGADSLILTQGASEYAGARQKAEADSIFRQSITVTHFSK